jgi:hemerythrin
MASMKWSEDLSVGVREIDEQHKKLVELLNQLHAAMTVGKAQSIMGDIIVEIVKYGKVHFKTEEYYFDKIGYEFSDEHKAVHKAFLDTADKLYNDFKAGNVTISIDTYKFLVDWVKNHIKKEDKKYTKAFNDNGIK